MASRGLIHDISQLALASRQQALSEPQVKSAAVSWFVADSSDLGTRASSDSVVSCHTGMLFLS